MLITVIGVMLNSSGEHNCNLAKTHTLFYSKQILNNILHKLNIYLQAITLPIIQLGPTFLLSEKDSENGFRSYKMFNSHRSIKILDFVKVAKNFFLPLTSFTELHVSSQLITMVLLFSILIFAFTLDTNVH